MGKRLGIDLGTTYSCISYVDDSGQVQFIESSDGNSQLTPSIVFFDPNGEVVVGATARQEGAMNPECLVERVKNHMGNPDYSVNMNGQDYSATAVSNLILRKKVLTNLSGYNTIISVIINDIAGRNAYAWNEVQ